MFACDNPEFAGHFKTSGEFRLYALAGKAHITFKSVSTGQHFSYKIALAKNSDDGMTRHFVSVLTGANNDSDYTYLGTLTMLAGGTTVYKHGRKSRISGIAPSARAFEWVWARTRDATAAIPPTLEVWHEGRCGKCARKLTVPSSIAHGFGPECAGKVGL